MRRHKARAVLQCSRERAPWIFTERWHDAQQCEWLTDEGELMTDVKRHERQDVVRAPWQPAAGGSAGQRGDGARLPAWQQLSRRFPSPAAARSSCFLVQLPGRVEMLRGRPPGSHHAGEFRKRSASASSFDQHRGLDAERWRYPTAILERRRRRNGFACFAPRLQCQRQRLGRMEQRLLQRIALCSGLRNVREGTTAARTEAKICPSLLAPSYHTLAGLRAYQRARAAPSASYAP